MTADTMYRHAPPSPRPRRRVFAVLADPATHAGDRRHRLGARVARRAAAHRGRPGLPHRRCTTTTIPIGDYEMANTGRGVRPAARHRVGAGPDRTRRRHARLRRLDLALRPRAGRRRQDRGHADLRLVGGSRTRPANTSSSRRSTSSHLDNSLRHLGALAEARLGPQRPGRPRCAPSICSRVRGRHDRATADPAQLVVDPAVRLAGAVMRERHQRVEFPAQIAQLAVGRRRAPAPCRPPRCACRAALPACAATGLASASASSRPGMPR